MQYYFSELDPTTFQRLVNAVLVARFGEALRALPLRGTDGGRDAVAVVAYEATVAESMDGLAGYIRAPDPGRYVFQVKHHSTINADPAKLRQRVITDFKTELRENVLPREGEIDHFILITNVPTTEITERRIVDARRELDITIHADVWWEADLIARLDQLPFLWHAFPEMFAGGRVPLIADVPRDHGTGTGATLHRAIGAAYAVERLVKFRQIELERELSRLFVDLGTNIARRGYFVDEYDLEDDGVEIPLRSGQILMQSAMTLLLSEEDKYARILLEGGPGQGKSTVTQMVAQVYRQQVLKRSDFDSEGRWQTPKKARIPIRVELRKFSEWLPEKRGRTLDEYLAESIRHAAASKFTLKDFHALMRDSPLIVILDGLDEVGSDALRDRVVDEIVATEGRSAATERSDVRFIVTTRPPALEGRRAKLARFEPVQLAYLSWEDINDYVDRWTRVQLDDVRADEVRKSFETRRANAHVAALSRNPMQLAVLLHLIDMRGEAFPDRHAELYREYFKTVIDRDVEKNDILQNHRDLVEALHAYLGFTIHARVETQEAAGTLRRAELLRLTNEWLRGQRTTRLDGATLFRVGEERFGLIVSLAGEGREASYGFDIQPTREYFAAAYINDHVAGDAHRIFEEMVPRAYWREVAIFVAGLRRPKEKADLLERLRCVDRHEETGWRSFGRLMALDLIEGGVFDDPEYLYQAAALFVLQMFDRRAVPYAKRDVALVRRVAAILQPRHTPVATEVGRLLMERSSSNDAADIGQLLMFARHVLPAKDFRKRLLAFADSTGEVRALARTEWPAMFDVDLGPAPDVTLPSDQDARIWSFHAVRAAAMRLERAPAFPPQLHEQLIEQSVFAYPRVTEGRGIAIPVRSELVWALMAFEQWAAVGRKTSFEYTEGDLSAIAAFSAKVDTSGLPEVIARPLSELFALAAKVLIAVARMSASRRVGGNRRARNTSTPLDREVEHLELATRKCLDLSGIVSAAGAKVAHSLLDSLPAGHAPNEVVKRITKNLDPFMTSFEQVGFSKWDPDDRSEVTAMRVHKGLPPVPIATLVASSFARDRDFDLQLLDRIPIPMFAVRDLFIPKLMDTFLGIVSRHRIVPGPFLEKFSRSETEALLKRLESKDDKHRLAVVRLIEWMSQVPAEFNDLVASALRLDREGAHAEGVFQVLSDPAGLAAIIRSNAEDYSVAYVSQSAQREAEAVSIRTPPLLQQREELGLHEQFADFC